MSNKMGNKFRDKLYDMEGNPSLRVWDGIEKSLAKKRTSRNWIYVGLSVILISGISYLGLSGKRFDKIASASTHTVNNQPKITNIPVIETNKTVVNETPPEIKNKVKINNAAPQIVNISQQIVNPTIETIKSPEKEIITKAIVNQVIKVKEPEPLNEDWRPLLKIQIVSDLVPMHIDPMFRNLVMNFRNTEVENNVRENIYQIQGFHFGVAADLNNTNILKQNNYNEFNGKNLSTKLTYGGAYGFNLGYDFNSRYGIQTEVLINAAKGQKFADTYNGMPVSRDISLKYDEVPVFFKYKMSTLSTLTRRPSVVNFIGGFEYGYLLSANENLMGTVTDITNRFNHNDVSLLAGLEYNLYLGHHFFFALGMRGSYSLLDINAPGWKLEPGTGSTHNMIFEGNFGVNYLLN